MRASQYRNGKSDQSRKLIQEERDHSLNIISEPQSKHTTDGAPAGRAIKIYTFSLKAETQDHLGNFRGKLSNCRV